MNGKKILIVDDDPVILKSLSLKLTAQGYVVMVASDGSEAVSSIRTQRPDVILLDLTFPPGFGLNTCILRDLAFTLSGECRNVK